MFLGEYEHSLDVKGRVILPAKFRDQLSEGGYVAKGRGGCLSVFTPEEFENMASRVRELSNRGSQQDLNTGRAFFSGASEIRPDKQGRVAIPANLRDYAGLTRDVVVTGVFSRVEIWDRERWRVHDRVGDLALADSDELPDFGI